MTIKEIKCGQVALRRLSGDVCVLSVANRNHLGYYPTVGFRVVLAPELEIPIPEAP